MKGALGQDPEQTTLLAARHSLQVTQQLSRLGLDHWTGFTLSLRQVFLASKKGGGEALTATSRRDVDLVP